MALFERNGVTVKSWHVHKSSSKLKESKELCMFEDAIILVM